MAKACSQMLAKGHRAGYIAAVLAAGILIFWPLAAVAEPVVAPEYEVKLGFIYNFANFVTWPAEAFADEQEPLVFCFASEDPASEVLFKLDDKTIRGRKIKVIRYQEGKWPEHIHIFFFATQNKEFITKALNRANGRSILTIGEVEGFARMGGVINFFRERNRLRFSVNIDAAKRAGLKLSSQLLQSAQIVREE